MEKIRLILLEKSNGESTLFKKRAESFFNIQLINTVIYHPHVLEEFSPADADVFAVNINLPCNISFFIGEMKKKISPSKILMTCDFVQPDLIFNCLLSGASGYLEKYCSNKKFEQTIKDCHENLAFFPLSIIGLFYERFMKKESDLLRRKIFDLLSRGFLLKDVTLHTGLSEQEIKRQIYLSLPGITTG